ncbi:hypothetical protein TanjilG_22731 [Lupinus angustifolius]|uniref:Kinesin motor domain-containing protein n=1 Tax=Lupinus angustifolius TaxID=3871 RepID=A0A4P1RFH1_LUPAN|nr:hypothetical protein TanjilG_22731 [Lupinus angustifolius]
MESATEPCSVKVAVHVRPLISEEKLQGCKDCVTVVSGKPQVQIGARSFTFDHVYGSTASPSSAMFEECVASLVDGLFQGYNATVLAYGQTGSGKTYTMGTGVKDGCQTGIVPQVMSALFNKIETLKHQIEFQLHISFIEILKEEVRDLLDPSSTGKLENGNGHAGKVNVPGKPPIQIRETSNGVITLAGSTEVSVATLKEMAACLEQGSLSRATGSTNMNNQSSRSHAIFTITLEQMRKLSSEIGDSMNEDYLCAKLHLVDLAGSERAKRTGSDGLRFKEGVHINKGLLALGNVISALGDEKKRKEGVHVPYRDSKLTRLLQDSLGGNSRTVMIACISPADINAEETLNTLKYANRARNIQNKPVVNRDPMSNEMLKMRQQLECLQAELCARSGGTFEEMQVLKERIAWLETANEDLCHELHEYRSRCSVVEQCEKDSYNGSTYKAKTDGLKRGLPITSSDYPMSDTTGDSMEIEEVTKEWEHTLLQNSMDRELHELNKQLEQKESEMKLFGVSDAETLKQHFGRKIMELENEKGAVQRERDRLLAEVENLANSDGQTQKSEDIHAQKLKALEAQILDLKKKQESQVQLLKQKQKSDEATKKLQDEIQSIKAQKVQLQHKIKQEAEQFRQWKACREKEMQQLRKEGRRNEFERHKLQALNQRQKMVLHRKTEEAAIATKRLKELLEARKSSSRDNSVTMNGSGTNGQSNEKSLQRLIDHELEVMVKEHEVRFEYEKQSQMRAALGEELALLKQVNELAAKGLSPPRGKNGFARASSMSPNARMARIASLENLLSISSNSLVAMASQLSEAEERERAIANRVRWNQLRSMAEAKNLLQYMFNSVADDRCQLWEKDMENREMKEQIKELVGLLRQSEIKRKEIDKELKVRVQAAATTLATTASVRSSCISPADINAEETLNTLKYANRARNIQNKPVVNRDPMSNEMLKMRQQLECLQAELCARSGGTFEEMQVLKERIAWLETANEDLCHELHEYRSRCSVVEQCEKDSYNGSTYKAKTDGLKRGLPITSSDYPMSDTTGDSMEIEEVTKEWEHTLLQNSMDRELHELNKQLEQKESEMKLFGVSDAETLKQHFGRKIMELENEKGAVQRERDRLLAEVENLANSDGQTQKSEDIHAQKLKALEAQILDLKKKQESQVQLLKQKQKSDEATKKLQDEIQSIKAQKVQLQHKIKQEAEQFRQWKACREKEMQQLRKEGRRNEFERHKLQALNQRQKMVLHRKTEEAAIATKRLKELLEARKSSSRDNSVTMNGSGTNGQSNEKSLQRLIDHELEVMVKEHEVRFEYEKQSQMRAALGEELALLKQVNELAAKGLSPPRGKNGFARASSMSPNARMARIASLENLLSISSNSLVAMASQLSEAEERERAIANRVRWNQLRSMAEAKNLLQYMFNSVADDRCQLWEKDMENREMKEQIKELVGLLRQSEIKRKEIDKELKVRVQAAATTLATTASGNPPNSVKHYAEDINGPLSPESDSILKQCKYTPGIANGHVRESAAFIDQSRRMVPMGQLSMKKLAMVGQASGKLWRWKRSHHQWLLQFKWKWQKPWRLSEWIRHSDETIMRAKPRSQALPHIM